MTDNNIFRYDGPVVKMLTRIANLMLLSVYWTLCCLPVITIIPSCTALYRTIVEVVRNSGSGVTRAFFSAFKEEFKKGILLSLGIAMIGGLLYYSLYIAYQTVATGFGLVYFLLGVVISLFVISIVLFIPPTLSHFEGGYGTILRLALYFAMNRPWTTLLSLGLLVVIGVLIWFYPPVLIVLPGIYVDLVCGSMEKKITAFQDSRYSEGGEGK